MQYGLKTIIDGKDVTATRKVTEVFIEIQTEKYDYCGKKNEKYFKLKNDSKKSPGHFKKGYK